MVERADARPVGFWLKLVDTLIEEQFEAVLEEHGVTRRQWQLLNVLRRGPADRAALDAEVAPFLDGEELSADEHLAELLESGWVAPGYSLTDAGSTALSALGELVAGLRERAARGIDEAEYATTLSVLERMAGNLG